MKSTDAPRGGALDWRRGKPRLRLSLGSAGRRMVTLSACATEAEAEERRTLLVRLADRLVASGQGATGFALLQKAAARNGRQLDAVVRAVELLASGEARARTTAETTIRELATQWTSGELARRYPDHVRAKSSADDDAKRFEAYVFPIAGDIPVSRFAIDHAEEIMRRLPSDLAAATRRQVAQAVHRLIVLAVYPLRLLAANPLPRGFLPRTGPAKAKSYLYPDEDRKLLACAEVPLVRRVLYGFLAREGMRAGEALALTWASVDMERGAVRLDANKTDDPRAWSLRPDVLRALRAWRTVQAAARRDGAADPIFHVTSACAATRFREHLERAGIQRPELFERTKLRQPIRVHDLRATFVTISLANGKTEAWIQDRTGHKSSQMVNLYRRAARTAEELSLGELAPLDTAIPELAPPPEAPGTPPAGEASGAGQSTPERPCAASEHGCSAPESAAVAAGTGLVPAAPGAPSRLQSRAKRSVWRRVKHAPRASKSAILTGVRVQVPSSAPSENPSVFRGPTEPANAEPEAGRYQIGTSALDTAGASAITTTCGRSIARLASELSALVAAGDLEGAREVHETIGRLLAPAKRALDVAEGAKVVDLEAARGRRAAR